MPAAKVAPKFDKAQIDIFLAGYFCFCAGMIVGLQISRKGNARRLRETAEFQASGKEYLEKFEEERKAERAELIEEIAAAVLAKFQVQRPAEKPANRDV